MFTGFWRVKYNCLFGMKQIKVEKLWNSGKALYRAKLSRILVFQPCAAWTKSESIVTNQVFLFLEKPKYLS